MTSIETRIGHAGNALAAYLESKGEDRDGDASIVDLVADLLHMAKAEGHDPEAVLRMATSHVEAETQEAVAA
jgi:membrane-bound ClpP family serine protease